MAEAGKLCLLKKKEKGKQEKKVIWGQCNPMEMPRLLFSEEAGLVSQETFDCIYLLLQKKKKRRFFIAALICQLIIFSYKTQPWLHVIHSVSYHDSYR